MAFADLSAELECSVCLNIFTDPVILKCGHNFCQVCIDCVLDSQEGSGGYSCPECRETFHERPAMHRNIKLRNIVQNFLSNQADDEESEVFCTYCVDSPVRFCLHCDICVCEKHLTVHNKSPEHMFTDFTLSPWSRKCSIHKKKLEYYCTEDNTCVCVSCCLIGGHTGHKMESLEEASGKTKNKMRNVLQKMLTKREKMEEKVKSLQKCRTKVEDKAAGDTERVTALFRDISRQLKTLEKKVLSEISGQTKRVSLCMLDLIQELEIKKNELSRKTRHIEKLCNMKDPLIVLRQSDTGDLCDTEDGDNEDRKRDDKLLYDGDLDMDGILRTLHTGLSDIMSGVSVRGYTNTHVYPYLRTEDKGCIVAAQSPGGPQPVSTIQGTLHQPGSIQPELEMWELSKDTDIILDVSTAGNDLCISDNRNIVSCSVFTHKYPETPGRFQSAQVLSSQSFCSGQHYWEVDVAKSQVWSVGMCYPSIDRRGSHSEIGWNTKSWGLHKSWLNNQYSVLYNRNWIRLPGKVSSNRVRIYLDYEAGQISFYDLRDPIHHLYTFTATFTEPLYAVLWVGGGCVKIRRGICEKSTQVLMTSLVI